MNTIAEEMSCEAGRALALLAKLQSKLAFVGLAEESAVAVDTLTAMLIDTVCALQPSTSTSSVWDGLLIKFTTVR